MSITQVALRFIQIKGATSGTPDEMAPCIDFSHNRGVKLDIKALKLNQFDEMVEMLHKGEVPRRLAVKF